jgi:hypothetical protein
MLTGSLALAVAAAYTGAALYINLVEQPARLALDDAAMLAEWRPSDRRGFAYLATLALVAAVFALGAYFQSSDPRWLIGGLIIVASWPYVYFAMAPLNNRILALSSGDAASARALVRDWGMLEIGQSAIGVVACVIFIWAL